MLSSLENTILRDTIGIDRVITSIAIPNIVGNVNRHRVSLIGSFGVIYIN